MWREKSVVGLGPAIHPGSERTLTEECAPGVVGPAFGHAAAYLPGRGDTMITKVVCPGRGLSIAQPDLLQLGEFDKRSNLNCTISGSGGLRSRSPLLPICLMQSFCSQSGRQANLFTHTHFTACLFKCSSLHCTAISAKDGHLKPQGGTVVTFCK